MVGNLPWVGKSGTTCFGLWPAVSRSGRCLRGWWFGPWPMAMLRCWLGRHTRFDLLQCSCWSPHGRAFIFTGYTACCTCRFCISMYIPFIITTLILGLGRVFRCTRSNTSPILARCWFIGLLRPTPCISYLIYSIIPYLLPQRIQAFKGWWLKMKIVWNLGPSIIKCTTAILNVIMSHLKFCGIDCLARFMMGQKQRKSGASAFWAAEPAQDWMLRRYWRRCVNGDRSRVRTQINQRLVSK